MRQMKHEGKGLPASDEAGKTVGMAKQNEVTAESMMRRARAHRAAAKERRVLAADNTLGPLVRLQQRGIAMGHEDTAKILRAEAKEIRSHR